MKFFYQGFKAMLPVVPGIVPFGLVMGTVCANNHLDFFKTIFMNFFVFAGASQLAALDLMGKESAIFIVVLAGIIINLRFVLYSASLSTFFKDTSLFTKMIGAYLLTDQNYAVMSIKLNEIKEKKNFIKFYFGTSLCMVFFWHLSVILGFIFGNFSTPSISLDFAVPLSFLALTMPSLKSKKHRIVAFFSVLISLILTPLPFNLGLIITAILGSLFVLLILKKGLFS